MFPIYCRIIDKLLESPRITFVDLQNFLKAEYRYHPNNIASAISELTQNGVINNDNGMYVASPYEAKNIKPFTDKEILDKIFMHLYKYDESAMTIDSINRDLKMGLTEDEKKYYNSKLESHPFIDYRYNDVIKLSNPGRSSIFEKEREEKAKRGRIPQPDTHDYLSLAEKEKLAQEYMEILFPYYPDFTPFDIQTIVTDYQIKEKKSHEDMFRMRELQNAIQGNLIRLQYADIVSRNDIVELNNNGRSRKRILTIPAGLKDIPSIPVHELKRNSKEDSSKFVMKRTEISEEKRDSDKPKSDRLIDKAKNHPVIGIIIFIALVILGFIYFFNQIIGCLDTYKSHFSSSSNKDSTAIEKKK